MGICPKEKRIGRSFKVQSKGSSVRISAILWSGLSGNICHEEAVITYILFFAIAAQKGWSLYQIDVTAAYLNSTIGETVYMEQPVLGTGEGKSDLVCKLKKSIYGLHQAGCDWNEYLTKLMLELGMKQSMSDPCVL
jgi:hypothetical protein